MRIALRTCSAALAVVAVALMASPAHAWPAAYEMIVTDNMGNTITVTDIGGGLESVAYVGVGVATGTGIFAEAAGELNYNGSFAGLTINSDTAFNETGPTTASLDLSYDNKSATGAGTVTIMAYHLDETYSSPSASPPVTLTETASNNGTGPTFSAAGYNPLNLPPAGPFLPPFPFLMPFMAPVVIPGLGTASDSILVPFASPFSLMQETTIDFVDKKIVSGNDTATTNAAPEPGMLAILASGLPLLGFGAWRRRRKAAV